MKDIANRIENMSHEEFKHWEELAERKEHPERFAANPTHPRSEQVSLKIAAEVLKQHAWLERFRKGNAGVSPDAVQTIARYVDDFIEQVVEAEAQNATLAAEVERLRKENVKLARIVGCLEPDEYGRPSCGAPPNGCIVCRTLDALAPAAKEG